MKQLVLLLLLVPVLASAQARRSSRAGGLTPGESYCITGIAQRGYTADMALKRYCAGRTVAEAACMVGLVQDKYNADAGLKIYCSGVTRAQEECMTGLTPGYVADVALKKYCAK